MIKLLSLNSLLVSFTLTLIGLATLYLLASSIEIVAQKNILYIDAIERVESYQVLYGLNDFSEKPTTDEGLMYTFGQPKDLYLPSKKTKVMLRDSIFNENHWLARANSGHYETAFITHGEETSNKEFLIIYMRRGWRTLTNPELITLNENIFITTEKGWRIHFRVTENTRYDPSGQYLATDSTKPHLILVVEDTKKAYLYIIDAEFVNIQQV